MSEIARLEAALTRDSAALPCWLAEAGEQIFKVTKIIEAASARHGEDFAEHIRPALLAETRALVNMLRGVVPAGTGANVLPFARRQR
jgi:hypothetical protein